MQSLSPRRCRDRLGRKTRIASLVLERFGGERLEERRVLVVEKRAAMVANHAEGVDSQDWCQGHPARQVRDIPTGGSRRAPTTLVFHPRTDRQTPASTRTVSIRLTALPQSGWRTTVLAYATERLAPTAKKGWNPMLNRPNAQSKHTGPGAFRGMAIWEIPIRGSLSNDAAF